MEKHATAEAAKTRKLYLKRVVQLARKMDTQQIHRLLAFACRLESDKRGKM